MENNEFHQSFIKSLIFIAVVTMFAMVLSDKFINNYLSHKYKTPTFMWGFYHLSEAGDWLSPTPFYSLRLI